jgi:protein SCO1/2
MKAFLRRLPVGSGPNAYHDHINKPGTYQYPCALHDVDGMVGTVIVFALIRTLQMTLRIVSGISLALVFLARMIPVASAQAPRKPEPIRSQYRGGLINPLLPKPKFVLTDTSEASFDFSARTQGYVTLLFFGYTHCPDMCPLQMSNVARALRQLPPDVADQLKVVFVTTDPDRDTPQVIRTWLDHVDKRFVGLTGSQKAIEAAQVAANLPVSCRAGWKLRSRSRGIYFRLQPG